MSDSSDGTNPALTLAMELIDKGALSIDEHGQIWRHGIRHRDRILPIKPRRAENPAGKGYLRLTLGMPDGKTRSVMAHIVIWVRANGPIPAGIQVNHKDLNKKNNRPDNLELLTGAGNIQHSYANGRSAPWSKPERTTWRGKPRVTPSQMEEMQKLRSDGVIYREIAERFGISITHVQRITAKVKAR
jgi:hypothetical protein